MSGNGKPAARNGAGVIGLILLSLAVIVVILVYIQRPHSLDNPTSRPVHAGESRRDESAYSLKSKMLSVKSIIPAELGDVAPATKCDYNYRYIPEKGLVDGKGRNRPIDTPQVEFRFMKNGERAQAKRVRLIPFDLKKMEDVASYPCEGLVCEREKGFYACRLPVLRSRDSKEKYQDSGVIGAMVPGRAYIVTSTPLNHRRDPRGSSGSFEHSRGRILFVAPDLEPGTIAVCEVDLGVRVDRWETWKRFVPVMVDVNDDPKHGLALCLSDPGKLKSNPKAAPTSFTRSSPGRYVTEVRELGGQLVAIDNKIRYAKCAKYYVRSVEKAALTLPQDASLVFNEDEILDWRCPLPDDLPNDAHIIWLLVEKDDSVPVAWAPLKGKQRRSQGEVVLSSIPGQYFVAYGTSNIPVPFGTVEVQASDSGKLLAVKRIAK